MPQPFATPRRTLSFALAAAALAAAGGSAAGGPAASDAKDGGHDSDRGGKVAEVDLFAPHNGDRAGQGGKGWFVDLSVDFDVGLERTGFTGTQLTGPGAHANAAPFPGAFSPGRDDRFKSLVVLVSGNQAGPGANVANLFNLTGVTDHDSGRAQIWDTWIVGAPNFGSGDSTVYAAVVDDLDRNGVYDDAPDKVADADHDGDVDERDLKAMGLASGVEKADFSIAG